MIRTLFVIFLFSDFGCDYFVYSQINTDNVTVTETNSNILKDAKVTHEADTRLLPTQNTNFINTLNNLNTNKQRDIINLGTDDDQLETTYLDLEKTKNDDKISNVNLGRSIEQSDIVSDPKKIKINKKNDSNKSELQSKTAGNIRNTNLTKDAIESNLGSTIETDIEDETTNNNNQNTNNLSNKSKLQSKTAGNIRNTNLNKDATESNLGSTIETDIEDETTNKNNQNTNNFLKQTNDNLPAISSISEKKTDIPDDILEEIALKALLQDVINRNNATDISLTTINPEFYDDPLNSNLKNINRHNFQNETIIPNIQKNKFIDSEYDDDNNLAYNEETAQTNEPNYNTDSYYEDINDADERSAFLKSIDETKTNSEQVDYEDIDNNDFSAIPRSESNSTKNYFSNAKDINSTEIENDRLDHKDYNKDTNSYVSRIISKNVKEDNMATSSTNHNNSLKSLSGTQNNVGTKNTAFKEITRIGERNVTDVDETSLEDNQVFTTTESYKNLTLTSVETTLVVETITASYDEYMKNLQQTSVETSTSIKLATAAPNLEKAFISNNNCDVSNLHVLTSSEAVWTKWENCNETYDVNITKVISTELEMPHFRRVESNSNTTIERLEACTAYNVVVKLDSGEIHQDTLRTLPGDIEDLKIRIVTNVLYGEWTPSEMEYCSKYNVTINNNETYQTPNTGLALAYNTARCTSITVTSVDNDNNAGRATTRLVPGTVQDLETTTTANTLNITWAPPENSSCVVSYNVMLNNEVFATEELTYSISGLEYCTDYTVAVAAVSNTEDIGEYLETLGSISTPSTIAAVRNLAVQVLDDEDVLRATWDPPYLIGACITRYGLVVWDQDDASSSYFTTETFYDLTLVPCRRYYVMLKVLIGVREGVTITENILLPEAEANPPTLYSLTADKTWVNFNFTMQSYSTNKCTISSITVNCTAEGNEDHWWIVDGGFIETDYADSSTRPRASVTLENLSEFTNYTCHAYVENTGGTSNATEPFRFQTLEEVPSAPQNLQFTNQADGVVLTWEVPNKIPGIQGTYLVKIIGLESLHYIPVACGITVTEISDQIMELQYIFRDGLANYEYSVAVAASTNAGFGQEVTLPFTTSPGVSEPPRNITYEFEELSTEVYSVIMLIEWLLPCNTNGKLLYFNWSLEGQSLENGSIYSQSDSVYANEEAIDEIYQLNVTMQATHNYSMTIVAYTSNDIRGEDVVFYFQSPEGRSSEPVNLRVEDITTSAGTAVWEEPVNKNGVVQFYRVIVFSNGANHYIPDSCIINDITTVNISVDSLTLRSTFNAGLPNFRYTVTVNAVTGAGDGHESTYEFSTLEAEPEAPRNLAYYIVNNNVVDEIYNVTVDMTWLLPCNTNGDLSFFSWIFISKSLDSDESSNQTTDVLDANNDSTDINYGLRIRDIKPRYNYTFVVAAYVGVDGSIQGEITSVSFLSPDGYSSAPTNLRAEDTTAYRTNILWQEPENKNGEIQTYRLTVAFESLATRPSNCTFTEYNPIVQTFNSSIFNYLVQTQPYFEHIVHLVAATNHDYGSSATITFVSSPTEPEPVTDINIRIDNMENEIYEAYALVFFTTPCTFNGRFSHYGISIVGERHGFDNVYHIMNLTEYNDDDVILKLDAEFTYNGYITVYTSTHSTATNIENFTAPAGVPLVNSVATLDVTGSTSATLAFTDTIFDNTQGEILYYAVIISLGSTTTGGGFNLWDSSTWPTMGYWANLSIAGDNFEYQATAAFWNPFGNLRNVNYTFVIGEEECVKEEQVFCNGPLLAETDFGIRVRGFTAKAYRDSDIVNFTTLPKTALWIIILGVVVGVLALGFLIYFILLLWRRRKRDKLENKINNNAVQPDTPSPIPKSKFVEHCEVFEEDRSRFKSEYSHLESISAIAKPSSEIAMEDNNRKKNRYINIMAYDITRVKLATDDNDNYEDYINASYIKGYSGTSEYIATQGPMESTCEDFWRMVLQEDVGLIVMVAQFVEQSKPKCYKYFPLKEDTMLIGKDINVKCVAEVNFTDYVTRTLLVEKEGKKMSINHLQYMLWPDFGCPNNTKSMLEFREIMRKEMENTKAKAVVHCSAGVGRTGTLIAIDILLQKIDNAEEPIDIFGTVLELRKQRTHMVQTEKQYEYIHKCVRDYLITPKEISNGRETPIYENVNSSMYENVSTMNGIVSTINGNVSIKKGDKILSTENLIRLKEL